MAKIDLRDLALHSISVLGINIFFLGVAALVYWLLGVPQMIGHLALGFAALWGSQFVLFALSQLVENVFRLNWFDHLIRYVLMNALFGAVPLLGFTAFAALQAHGDAAGFGVAGSIALLVIGFLACYIAHAIVTTFFRGQLYRLINAAVGLVGFGVFARWPALARGLFEALGWN